MPSDDSFAELEAQLKALKPAPMSDDLLSRLASAMELAAIAPPDNVITMEDLRKGTQVLTSAKKKHTSSPKWRIAWAAAIALMGGATALLFTGQNGFSPSGIAENGSPSSLVAPLANKIQGDTITDAANSPLVSVAYDGVEPIESPLKEKTIWLNNDSPHKYIKVNYTKVYQATNPDGSVREVVLPATSYLLVPEEAY